MQRLKRISPWVATLAIALVTACSGSSEDVADTVVIACGAEMDRAALREMETLTLRGCGDIDFRVLWEAEDLESLYIHDPELKDIRLLAPLRNLRTLHLERSMVFDIGALVTMSELVDLRIPDTPLSSLDALRRLEHLEHLDISQSYVVELDPIADLQSLVTLEGAVARIADTGPLQGLTNLRHVDLSENSIRDIGPLAANTHIADGVFLDVSGNCLNLGSDQTRKHIDELKARGVRLVTEPQKPVCEDGYSSGKSYDE